MNRLRRGGWVNFWTSQIVDLSDQSESTARRARSILRDAGVLEERHLTSGEIAMRFDLNRLLAATPAVVGAPDDDVTVQEPKRRRNVQVKPAVNMTDIRSYGAPVHTLSTMVSGAPTRMREAVGGFGTPTNDLKIPRGIDSGPERPIFSTYTSTGDANATRLETRSEPLSDADRDLVSGVLSAFTQHPSIARLAKASPPRTASALATARRVAAMIREGVPIGALASATTHHLDAQYRQTGAVVWSLSYCEPAYDRLYSEWTMHRAQQTRLRDEQAQRTARDAEMRAEVVDDAVVDEVMTRYRRVRPRSTPVASTDAAMTDGDLRREIDALVAMEGGHSDHGVLGGVPIPTQDGATP
jgi:hypothetical protein